MRTEDSTELSNKFNGVIVLGGLYLSSEGSENFISAREQEETN